MENQETKTRKAASAKDLTMPRYLFILRKSSYLRRFFKSSISIGSSKDLSTASAT